MLPFDRDGSRVDFHHLDQPVRTSWWSRNWKWVIPVGIGAPILVCGGFITLIIALVTGLMKSSGAYQEALAAAQGDTAVVAALGTPIEEGFMVTGNIEMGSDWGYADLAIPISGPMGKATIYVEAEKSGDDWYYSTLGVAVHDTDGWIDLLGGQ